MVGWLHAEQLVGDDDLGDLLTSGCKADDQCPTVHGLLDPVEDRTRAFVAFRTTIYL